MLSHINTLTLFVAVVLSRQDGTGISMATLTMHGGEIVHELPDLEVFVPNQRGMVQCLCDH